MSWQGMNTPLKRSQFTLDGFEEWKKGQDAAVSQRGADQDPAKEQDHIQFMLRQNLNAYICFQELDEYTGCLRDHHLLRREDDSSTGSRVEINTTNKANEKVCRKTHNAYVQCLSSVKNQETVMQNAVLQPPCNENREELLSCMKRNSEVEVSTNQPQCTALYHALLRCGLNHQWNHYWRSLTKFGDAEEFHLYELSRDDNKKQEYIRLATSTPREQQDYQKYREDLILGYQPDNRASK